MPRTFTITEHVVIALTTTVTIDDETVDDLTADPVPGVPAEERLRDYALDQAEFSTDDLPAGVKVARWVGDRRIVA